MFQTKIWSVSSCGYLTPSTLQAEKKITVIESQSQRVALLSVVLIKQLGRIQRMGRGPNASALPSPYKVLFQAANLRQVKPQIKPNDRKI
jgi:hypothetical protein